VKVSSRCDKYHVFIASANYRIYLVNLLHFDLLNLNLDYSTLIIRCTLFILLLIYVYSILRLSPLFASKSQVKGQIHMHGTTCAEIHV
jgi:hypothetical protein